MQAAQFIGRDDEFNQLKRALQAARQGGGSAWLVAGESGIGKSRLLDELRTYGLIQQAWVLRGQAVEGGGLLYQVWREPLRRLALSTPLGDLEASILKEIVPDIGALQGREVPDAPSLDSRDAQVRLLRAIVGAFRAQQQPILLLLEDLQWANESLEVLQYLQPFVPKLPLLIVGSYRYDKSRDLPAQLPQMQIIRLERLSAEEITHLSRSMLGTAGEYTEVTDLLQRETEGNVFFIVEVVRTLAEEAGGLDRIGTKTLPQKVLAGGMQAILRRRLARLPDHALIQRAAVAGRVLDLNVLRQLPLYRQGMSPAALDQWLMTCADAAVLEVYEGAWRFTHDKLRETLISDMLTGSDYSALNREVAQAIEAAYPDPDQLSPLAPVLADHWHAAGDIHREAYYLEQAGNLALDNGLYPRAISYFERALALNQETGASALEKASLLQILGETHYNIGSLEAGNRCSMQALNQLGYVMPRSLRARQIDFAVQFVRQVVNPLALIHRQPSAQDRRRKLIAMKICGQMALIHYFKNERWLTAYLALYGLNIADNAGDEALVDRTRLYTIAGLTMALVKRKKLAARYIEHADRLLQRAPDHTAMVRTSIAAGIYSTVIADWAQAEIRLERLLQISREIGHVRRWEESAVTLIGVYYYHCVWDQAKTLSDALYASGLQSGNLQAQAWALDDLGRFALRAGQFDEALRIFKSSREIYEEISDTIGILWILGAIAKIHLCLGNLERARALIDQVEPALLAAIPTSFGMLEAYGAMVEFHLTLLERAPEDASERQAADRAIQALGRYSEVFSLARSRYWLYRSGLAKLTGHRDQASRLVGRAVSEAQRLEMAYDEGLAQLDYGRLPGVDLAERNEHLRRAIVLFEQLGAHWDLEQAQAALTRPEIE